MNFEELKKVIESFSIIQEWKNQIVNPVGSILINIALELGPKYLVNENEKTKRCLCSCKKEFCSFINKVPLEFRKETYKILKKLFQNRLSELQLELYEKIRINASNFS